MVGNHLLGGLSEPLEEGEILKLVRLEDLENLDGFVIAQVFDEMAHVLGHDADVSSLEVKGACDARGGEDGDACSSADEVRPLVGVWVPVHFTDGTGLDVEVCRGYGLGDRKVGRIRDADLASGGVEGFLLKHLVRELELGLLHSFALGLLLVDGPGQAPLENILVGWVQGVKDLWIEVEVLPKDRLGCMSCRMIRLGRPLWLLDRSEC